MSIQAVFNVAVKIDKITNIDISLFQQAMLTLQVYQTLPDQINYAVPIGVLDGHGRNKKTYDSWQLDQEAFRIKSSVFLINPSMNEIVLNQIYQFQLYLDVDVNQEYRENLTDQPNCINDHSLFLTIQLENIPPVTFQGHSYVPSRHAVKTQHVQTQKYQVFEINKSIYEYFPVEFTKNVYISMDCYLYAVLAQFQFQKDKFYRTSNGFSLFSSRQLHNTSQSLPSFVHLYKKFYKSKQSDSMLQILINRQFKHYEQLKRLIFDIGKTQERQKEQEQKKKREEQRAKMTRSRQILHSQRFAFEPCEEEDSNVQSSIQERQESDKKISSKALQTTPTNFQLNPKFSTLKLNQPDSSVSFSQVFQSRNNLSMDFNSIQSDTLHRMSFSQAKAESQSPFSCLSPRPCTVSHLLGHKYEEQIDDAEFSDILLEDKQLQSLLYEEFKQKKKDADREECSEFEFIMNMRLRLTHCQFMKMIEMSSTNRLDLYQKQLQQAWSNNMVSQYQRLMSRQVIASQHPAVIPTGHSTPAFRRTQAVMFRKQLVYLSNSLQIHNCHLANDSFEPVIYQDIYLQEPVFGRYSLGGGRTDYERLLVDTAREASGEHLIVLVHGYQGVSMDMQLFKNILLKHLPKVNTLLSTSNEMDPDYSIKTQGGHLASEVLSYLERCYTDSNVRVSFIAFSLGGLVVREAAVELKRHKVRLWTFMTLATPHLGISHTSSLLFRAGLKILQAFTDSAPIKELSLQDSPQITQTQLFRLAQNKSFSFFRNILLVGSQQDTYVPFDSVHIQYSPEKVYVERDGKQYKNMSENIFASLSETLLVKIDIDFLSPVETLLNKTSHLRIIQNAQVINRLVHCFLPLLQ